MMAKALVQTGGLVAWWTGNRFRRYGVWLDTAFPVITDQVRAALYWGMYERRERVAVNEFLRAGFPVVELGASIGFIAAQIARRAPGQLQVAVEPNPAVIPVLQRTLSLNGLDHVQVCQAAIDYADTPTARLRVGASTCLSRREDPAPGGRLGQSEEATAVVRACTLADILDTFAIREYVLVCDIEGAEVGLILEEEASVRARCRQLIIELHHSEHKGRTYTPHELGSQLCSRWSMRALHTDGDVWVLTPADDDAHQPG
jgi:FkbM family methyltransferase